MPVFEFTSPDGKTYEVEGPEGATPQQAFAILQGQAGAPAPQEPAYRKAGGFRDSPLPPSGFGAQVSRAFSGESAHPVKAPTAGELGQDYADLAGGVATGVPAGWAGTPGDIEGLGRLGLSQVSPVSRETALPTSSQFGDAIAGSPQSDAAAAGRVIGNLMSPGAAVKGVKALASTAGAVTRHGLGLATGGGGEAVRQAFKSGREGGTAGEAFRANMRGALPNDAVQAAKDAVEQMRRDKTAAYRQGINTTIKGDPTILKFAPIDEAIQRTREVGTYHGKTLSEGAQKVWTRIDETVAEWRDADPFVFQTPEGFDALKKKIGNLVYEEDLKSLTGPGSPGSVIVDDVYNAIKGQIVKQAKGYATVMKDYMAASDEIREIEKTLSLGRGATIDTSLRKLQSIMRNNANTNYGQRVELGNKLAAKAPAGDLLPKLAGQSMNSYQPRGLASLPAAGGALAALGTGNWQMLPYLAATSPRIVGEGVHAAGRLAGGIAQPFKNAGFGGAGNANVLGIGVNPGVAGLTAQQIMARLLLEQQPVQ